MGPLGATPWEVNVREPDDRPAWAPRPRRRRRRPADEFGGPAPVEQEYAPQQTVDELPARERYGNFQRGGVDTPVVHGSYGGDMLASRGSRLSAAIIDGLAAFVAFLPGMGALMSANSESGAGAGLIVMALALLGLGGYQLYLLTTQGQTIGKKMMSIRIVRYDDGDLPGFVKAVLMRSMVPSMIGQFIPFFGLVDVLWIFGSEQRCVHDLIAGTKVVDANSFGANVSAFD